jgi:hypothetical protein
MPNWCSDDIIFYQKDGGIDRLTELKNDLENLESIPYDSATADSKWMGKVLIKKCNFDPTEYNRLNAIRYKDNLDLMYKNDFNSRCFLSYCNDIEQDTINYPPNLEVQVESAWYPQFDLYNMIKSQYNLEYVILSEEPGCEVYINTDTRNQYFCEKYMVDLYNVIENEDDPFHNKVSDQIEREYIESDQELINFMNKYLGISGDHYTEFQANINLLETGISLIKYTNPFVKQPMVVFNMVRFY